MSSTGTMQKGYSGTAIFAKEAPLSVTYGIGIEELDTEGRLITLEYPDFWLVPCYTPNAQQGLARIVAVLPHVGDLRAILTDDLAAQHVLQLPGGGYVKDQRAAGQQQAGARYRPITS